MCNTMLRRLAPLLAALALALPAQAKEIITISKGPGVKWKSKRFTHPLSGPLYSTILRRDFGLINITHRNASNNACIKDSDLTTVAGMKVYPIPGATGIGFSPNITGTATYKLIDGTIETLQATITPYTSEGTVTPGNRKISNPIDGYNWCVPPRMEDIHDFYDPEYMRTVSIEGELLLVADGSQRNMEIKIPPMYLSTYSNVPEGDKFEQILPADITLRVSDLSCTVNTPLTIDFGHVAHSTEVDKELARRENQFDVSCTQDTNLITTNINVQFAAKSGLYNASKNKLALSQGGGYVTGELNGLTGDGHCGADNGITFDDNKIELGKIEAITGPQNFNHRVTWRLCSGGKDLPIGPVDASAELLVTFN